MTTRFLHTADWQLGKPFASVRDESKRHRLQQARLGVLDRLATIAGETGAQFVLVAGDLFDSSHATKAIVSAACAAIGKIGVPVFVIPGNHDHGGPGSIWQQEFFQREMRQLASNLRVLLDPEPVILENAVIFPAPLLRRHDAGDPTTWIRQAATETSFPADLPRIVLAHGTIQGFGSVQQDEDGSSLTANRIDLNSLPGDALDYIALGDWHGTKQITPKAWYSGTPEIDRFPKGDGNDPGNCLFVTARRGHDPQVEKISTGQFVWKEMTYRFSGEESLQTFLSQLDELVGSRGGEHLVSLVLEGSLGIEASGDLERALESWEARLLRLKLDHRVAIAPTEEEIEALTRRTEDPLIASVATQLVESMRENSEDAAIARLALRELHAALT